MIDIELALIATLFGLIPAGYAVKGYYLLARSPGEKAGGVSEERDPELFMFVQVLMLGTAFYMIWPPLFVYAALIWPGLASLKAESRQYTRDNPWFFLYWFAYVGTFSASGFFLQDVIPRNATLLGVPGLFLVIAQIVLRHRRLAANKQPKPTP